MDHTVMSRSLRPVCLSILLILPSTTSTTTLTTSLTTLSILTFSASASNFCPVEETDYMADDNTIKEYFECPGADDPLENTICCGQNCCPVRHIDSVMQVDIKVAMMISLSIILISLATAVILVVCCFKHGCPLYDTCSGSYKRTNNIPYGSDYDGSDQDLLQGNGNVKTSKKFYRTTKDKKVDIDSAQHV